MFSGSLACRSDPRDRQWCFGLACLGAGCSIFTCAEGSDGIVVAGTTGESPVP